VVNALSGRVNPAPAWQPYFQPDWRGMGFSQCEQIPGLAPTLPAAPADWQAYANAAYGFSFRYPADWTLEESAHAILLQQGANQIAIDFSRLEENIHGGFGPGPNEVFVYSGHVSFFGQSLLRYLLANEGKLKTVCYGIGSGIVIGDMRFSLSLTDSSSDYPGVDLSAALQQVADQVVESFTWIPTPPP
jgi:hypothetical protein